MLSDYLDIPLFPLPNVTFFPNTYLPLHVFEKRYRAMTENCLTGDRLMGVVLLKPGWENGYFEQPLISKIFTVGKIVDHERVADGNYNIVLEGITRVRMIEEYPTQPYRTAHVEVLQDWPLDDRKKELSDIMKELRQVTNRLGEVLPQARPLVQNAFGAHPHPGVVGHHLATSLVIDAYDRQSILEQDDPLRRLRLILVQLRNIIFQLQTQTIRGEVADED